MTIGFIFLIHDFREDFDIEGMEKIIMVVVMIFFCTNTNYESTDYFFHGKR